MNELATNLMRLRKLNGLTQQAVADTAGISRVAYRSLEKGEAEPRETTLHALAKALDCSAMDLLSPVPELKSLRFRANKAASEQERAQSDLVIARSANWLYDFNELEEALHEKRDSHLKPARKGAAPEKAAQQARKQLLGEHSECDCVPDLCELLESSNIKLFLFDFKMTHLFGLSIGPEDGGPAIAIHTGHNISVERQIFSLAHELGHLFLHKDSYGKPSEALTDEQEAEADRFAAAFLMPRDKFENEWNENRGLHWVDAVLKTKRHFKVSYQAVLRQLIEMGKAEHPAVYKKFRADYETRYGKKLEWNEEPPASPEMQADLPARPADEPYHLDPLDLMEDRLATLVRDALDKELITVSRAAEILDVGIEEMRERMKSWRVVK
jgi:Zn-dependent peptidase ImmA (M78 family)/DNA-binding XRE family transcriptional regulator